MKLFDKINNLVPNQRVKTLNQENSNLRKIIFDLNVRLQDSNEANKYLMDYIKIQKDDMAKLRAENILLEREASVSKSKLAALTVSDTTTNS